MSTQRDQQQYDEAHMRVGDTSLSGVDMRTPPQTLPPGLVSYAENTRFRYGVASPRKGVQALTWASLRGITFPIEFPLIWDQPVNLGEPVGVGLWRDPDGSEWQLVAAKSGAFDLGGGNSQILIWAIKPGNLIRQVPTPGGSISSAEGEVWFESSFNVVTLHRGPTADSLVMTNIDVGFKAIVLSEGGTGTVAIPRSNNATYFQNRLIVPHRPAGALKTDVVAVSDILDYTRYLEQINDFRINQGDSDEIVRAYPFGEFAIIFFKTTSIYAVSNLQGDWSANARLELITKEFGLVGPRSIAQVGADVIFLTPRGVTSIRQTEFNKMQGVDTPLSEPIQPLIDRINWLVAKTTASAAYYRDRYYLSVPIDGAAQNNAVLVYDFLNKAWAGLDTGEAANVKYFQVADFAGVEQLYSFSNAGGIGLYEYGEEDDQQVVPSVYTAEIFLLDQPSDGSTITINSGDIIRATRQLSVRDGAGNTLIDAEGNEIEVPSDINILDPEPEPDVNIWGVGDYGADKCTVAAANLFLGLTTAPEGDTDPWEDFADSVEAIECGVRLTDSAPIAVSVNDPAIAVIATPALAFEPQPIRMTLITRGYGYGGGDRRRFTRTQVYMDTWNALYEVSALVDGVNEEEVLVDAAASVASRVAYTTADVDDWDATNANEDHANPHREDYSVTIPAGGLLLGADGVQLDLYQAHTHRLLISQHGAFYRVKFVLSQGRANIHAITASSINFERRFGKHG